MKTRIYFGSVVALLLVTAFGKMIMVFGKAPWLNNPSPIFDFASIRAMLVFASLLEIIVAALVILYRRHQFIPTAAVAWLSTVIIGYRIALWIAGSQGFCDCLGVFAGVLDLSAKQASWIALGIAIYFLIGSYGMLLGLLCQSQARGASASPVVVASHES